MGKIHLEGMEFFAYHGCFNEEQIIGTRFLVDLVVGADTLPAEQSDKLNDTLNYTELYQIIKLEMQIKSHLLEHVAGRIVVSLCSRFPQINSINLKIAKLNPPVRGKVKQIAYQTFWNK